MVCVVCEDNCPTLLSRYAMDDGSPTVPLCTPGMMSVLCYDGPACYTPAYCVPVSHLLLHIPVFVSGRA